MTDTSRLADSRTEWLGEMMTDAELVLCGAEWIRNESSTRGNKYGVELAEKLHAASKRLVALVGDAERLKELLAVHELIADDIVFCHRSGGFITSDDDKTTLGYSVLCNDVFSFACADGERITPTEAVELHRIMRERPKGVSQDGIAVAWCAWKRGVKRSDIPKVDDVCSQEAWDYFDAARAAHTATPAHEEAEASALLDEDDGSEGARTVNLSAKRATPPERCPTCGFRVEEGRGPHYYTDERLIDLCRDAWHGAATPQQPEAWLNIKRMKHGVHRVVFDGPTDPRTVHDNGGEYFPLYRGAATPPAGEGRA